MESSSIKFLFYVLVLVVQSMNWKSEGVMNWCIVEHMVIVAPPLVLVVHLRRPFAGIELLCGL